MSGHGGFPIGDRMARPRRRTGSVASIINQNNSNFFITASIVMNANYPGGGLPAANVPGFRHFLSDRPPAKSFKIHNKEPHFDQKSTEELRQLMTRLAKRMNFDFPWSPHKPDALKAYPTLELWENPEIPSGYTYLLQLVAHDLVATSAPLSILEDARTGARNTRSAALRLDTIYGGGPAACPFIYAPDDKADRSRSALRLGPMQRDAEVGAPPRDIARVCAPDADESQRQRLTEPVIADPRNDDNAILAQMTTLFHLLHKTILDLLPPAEKMIMADSYWEAALDRFFCARGAVTLIYRNIIRKDLLKLILHEEIYKRYFVEVPDFIDELAVPAQDNFADALKKIMEDGFGSVSEPGPAKSEKPVPPGDPRIPLEFSHAAFRFGHAMLRQARYRINEMPSAEFSLDEVLKQTCAKNPGAMPLDRKWIVRWSYFFKINDNRPNLSQRIGPFYAQALMSGDLFPPIDDYASYGLAYRDLLGAGFLNLWSVDGLIEALKDARPELIALSPLLSDGAERARLLKEYLDRETGTSKLTPQDIQTLAADPPLLFFILFEAAMDKDTPGLRLGVLGSIIVAEVIFAALAREPLTGETVTGKLTTALETLSWQTYGTNYLSSVPEISSMAELIKFVAKARGYEEAKPGFL
jgi:hypothetical protein